jgi:GNAT superfamily N-acetyltransferase
MKYIEDKDFKYKDELLKTLRTYNLKHTGTRESSTEYFYAVDGDKLLGSVYAYFSWDWVYIDELFYENTDILKKLISELSNYYKNRAVGIKTYIEVAARAEDFKSLGFNLRRIKEGTPKTPRYFYLEHTDFDIISNSQIEVIVTTEKIDKYNSILLNEIEIFDRDNNIYPSGNIDLMFVALENDKFVGGVYGSITEDSMNISWLAVDEAYRGNRMGTNLMCKIEEKAIELNVYSINLGTTEFQAREFYEKLGYKVVFVKENDPKGFKSYNMLKII